MKWDIGALMMFLGFLGFIATIVLFILACSSQTPFNMQNRTEGLLVATVLAIISTWLALTGCYFYERQRQGWYGGLEPAV